MVGSRSRRATITVAALMLVSACSRAGAAPIASSPSGVADELDSCVVSDLLVPTCGVWLGASTPSTDGAFDYVRGLEEYESLTSHQPAILHFYQRGGEAFPTAEHRALAERPGNRRSLLYFNWKPAPDLTWRQIADGAADESITAVARGIAGYSHRMFLTIQHEPEDDVIDRPESGMTPADYVAMYRHVVTRFRELGVDNVVYVMGYMGFQRWASLVDPLYPGDDVVDWIAYDPYGFESDETFGELLNRPNAAGWPGFYRWATDKSPGTPIMLAEWGFDLSRHAASAELLEDAVATLRQDFPAIKALVYWNDRGERVDARIGQGGEIADRFAEAYATLADDPFVNATSTEVAP